MTASKVFFWFCMCFLVLVFGDCFLFGWFDFGFLKGKLPNDYPEEILGYVEERLQRYSISTELCVYVQH